MIRYTRAVACAVGLGLLWVCARAVVPRPLAAGADGAVGKVVRASRFELVEPGGRVRGELSAGGLVLFDGAGKARTRLAVGDGGVELEFLDAGARGPRAALRVSAEGESSLELRDGEQKPRAKLRVAGDGAADLRLYGGNRQPRLGACVTADDRGSVFLYGAKGKPAAELAVGSEDEAELALYDGDGKRRARFAVSRAGAPSLTMFDRDNERQLVFDTAGFAFYPDGGPEVARLGLTGEGKLGLRVRWAGSEAELGADKDGASLVLSSHKHKGCVRLRAAGDGAAELTLADRVGRLRAGLFVRSTGELDLKLCDDATTPRIWLRVDKQPHLEFFDGRGRCRSRLELKEDGTPHVELPKADEPPPPAKF